MLVLKQLRPNGTVVCGAGAEINLRQVDHNDLTTVPLCLFEYGWLHLPCVWDDTWLCDETRIFQSFEYISSIQLTRRVCASCQQIVTLSLGPRILRQICTGKRRERNGTNMQYLIMFIGAPERLTTYPGRKVGLV